MTLLIQIEFNEVAGNMSRFEFIKNPGECVEKLSDTEYNFRFWLATTYSQEKFKVGNTSRGQKSKIWNCFGK